MHSIVSHLALGLVFVLLPVAATVCGAPRRTTWLAVAVHPLGMLALYVTFALHMHQSLGGWPDFYGNHGLSDSVVLHGSVTQIAFGSLLIACLFVWPVATLFCACVPRWRVGLRPLGAYLLMSVVTLIATQLAPDPFLTWWWD